MDWYFAAATAAAAAAGSSNSQTAPLTTLISPCPATIGLTRLLANVPVPAPTTFPYFQRLPAELRVMVWKFAMPGARNVELVSNGDDGREETEGQEEGEGGRSPVLRAKNPDPALLHTNREARHEFLKNNGWRISFVSTDIKPFYFNHSIDTLQISFSQWIQLFLAESSQSRAAVSKEFELITRVVLSISSPECLYKVLPLGRWIVKETVQCSRNLEYLRIQYDVKDKNDLRSLFTRESIPVFREGYFEYRKSLRKVEYRNFDGMVEGLALSDD